MSLFEYLSSKAVTLCFLIIGGMLTGIVFAAANVSAVLFGMITAVYLVMILCWFIVGYRIERKKNFKIGKNTG